MNQLANRITLAIVVVLGLVLGITAWLSIQNERQELRKLLEKQGTSTAKIIAAHSVEMLIAQDYPALEFMLATISRETPDILRIEVDHKGRTILRVGDPKAQGVMFRADVILKTHEAAPPRNLGQVRVLYSDSSSDAIIADHVRDAVAAMLAAFVALVVTLRMVLRSLVIKPIGALTRQTEQVIREELPDYAQTVPAGNGRDEIGDLSERFQTMLDGLQARERAQLKAESASEAKSQFLAHMSHEMRTPLNGIIGFQKLLSRTALDATQREYLRSSEVSAKSLLSVIDDILDFSKIEAGKLVIETGEFDLRALIEDAVAIHYGNAVAKGVDIQLVCHRAVPMVVRGSPDRILQIVSNLLSNAVKFTERGEILVKVEALGAEEATGTIEISVQDSGIGMNEEQLQRIFQPFVQGDASTTRRFGGTGLGLAISSKLAGLMGGELGVNSEIGKGSRFRLRLPLPAIQVPEIRLPSQPVCILCNQASLAQGLTEMLAVLGLSVRVTAAMIEAEDWLRQQAAAAMPLIIADYRMAGDNSAALRERLERIRHARWHWLCPPDMPSSWVQALGEDEDWQSFPVRFEQTLAWLKGERHVRSSCADFRRPEFRGVCLVVDDNDINRCLVSTLLQELGLETVEADNGERAVALCSVRTFDMIFMDIHMPVMDGLEATRKIRTGEGKDRHTPIVALTANAFPGDAKHYLDSDMDDVITKPLREEQVIQILQRWGLRSGSSHVHSGHH